MEEIVTTLCIKNIPSHTSEADFNCWFLFANGFEASTLAPTRGGNGTQTGWARFTGIEDAKFALQLLDGRQLTESPELCVLSAEFAKKNFKAQNPFKKRPHPDEDTRSGYERQGYDATQYDGQSPISSVLSEFGIFQSQPQQGQQQPSPQPARHQYDPSQFDPPEPARNQYDPTNFDPPQYDPLEYGQYSGLNSFGGQLQSANAANDLGAATAFTASAPTRAFPSSTLFLGKLADTATEQELMQIFPTLPNFERLKFVPPFDGKSGMCFAKFYTPESADEALQALTGYRLPSSPHIPLQVQFAKNDLDQPSGRGPPPAAIVGSPAWAASTPMRPAPSPHTASGGTPGGEVDTMFIGNLASSVSEDELLSTLQSMLGFVRLKYVGAPQKPMGFALFDSVNNCRNAISQLHGMSLPSAPEQAMLCQFAKNSLDKPPPKFPRHGA